MVEHCVHGDASRWRWDLSAVVIGSILSTALLMGGACDSGSFQKIANRFATAMVVAALLGVVATWLGIAARLRPLFSGALHVPGAAP